MKSEKDQNKENQVIEDQELNQEDSKKNKEDTTSEKNEDQKDVSEEDKPLSEIEKKDLEIEALNNKYLRLYSEFDNFRKRTQKEKLELYKTAGEDIFKSLLPVVDDFERAKKSMEENKDYKSLKEGVDLIFNKLLSSLKANGLNSMDSPVGKEFNSDIHEAITQIEAPNKKMSGKVVDQEEKGYVLNDKVIRYAKAVVGK